MFSEKELEEYEKLFKHLNINKEEQQQVLEFFYIMGSMIYSHKESKNGKIKGK